MDFAAARRKAVSIERLLDGVEVEIEPVAVGTGRGEYRLERDRASAPTVQCTRGGSGVLELVGGATACFSRHRLTILPPPKAATAPDGGVRHVTAPRTGTPSPAALPPATARRGDPDIVTACVRMRATYRGSVNLFDQLPAPLVERLGPGDPILGSLEELVDEITAWRPGSRAMAETLLRRCLILLLRRRGERSECPLTWVTALEDAGLGRAVAAMHERPQHAFTLSELAEVAGMSRTIFAARFTEALAQPPMEFLKRLRLEWAAALLSRTELPVKTVAAQVGYSSRSSFTRAFVSRHGAAPTSFRGAAGAPATALRPPSWRIALASSVREATAS